MAEKGINDNIRYHVVLGSCGFEWGYVMYGVIDFFQSLTALLRDLNSDYGSLLEITFYVLSGIISLILGKKVIVWLFTVLLDQRDEAQTTNDLLQKENETLKQLLATKETELKTSQNKINRARAGFAHPERDLWLRKPFNPPENYHDRMRSSKPITMVANLKGGVGKTTIATCLSSFLDLEYHERVLVIDLDYQGSMSSMLLQDPRNRTANPSIDLLEAKRDIASIIGISSPLRNTSYDSRIIQCHHNFANYETHLALKWLIDDISKDIRYNLANVLLSDEIQDNFDRIIIDAPPRVTTGFINALCTSTHLLIPTMLDHLSVEAVDSFLADIRRMRGELFPELQVAAIIGTMKAHRGEPRTSEANAIQTLKELSNRELGSPYFFLEDHLIPRIEAISSASGRECPYSSSSNVKSIFNPLGKELYIRTTDREENSRYEDQRVQTDTRVIH